MLPNIVFFEGTDATDTVSLWETDGTAGGTFELTDVPSGAPLITGQAIFGFAPSPAVSLDLTVFNNQVLFSGRVGPTDIGPFTLWTSDGTVAGTVPLTITGAKSNGLFSPTVTPGFTVFGAEVLFRGLDTSGASGLWMTDGTAPDTKEITGVNGAASTGVNPTDITVLNDTAALFNGENAALQQGLWTTTGNGAGTHELTSIDGASASGLNPTDITAFNGKALFNGLDANGLSGLWMTNGSAAGTHELLAGAGASGLDPTDMTVFESEVLFSALDANGLTGLWVTDGTAGGTHEVFAEAAGATAAKDPHGLSPTDLTVFNGEVFFSGFDQNGHKQLWETDGTAVGTKMLTVAAASRGGLNPSNMEIYNGQLLFQGNGQQRVSGLWTTDGTGPGTQEITPIPGVYSFGFAAEDLTSLTPGSSSPPPLPTVAPTIAGTVSGETTSSEAPISPFAHVTIGDAQVGATETLTITLGGKGGTLSDGTGFSSLTAVSAGVYRLSGTAAAITSELDALIFKPTAGAPNTTSTTTFTLRDLSSVGRAVADSTTSVIDSDSGSTPPPPTAPTIAGTVAGQTTTSETPVRPFADVTIGDANAGATDTLTITLGGKGGTLTDGTGFSSLTTVSAGVYRLSGIAAAITSELEALLFTPTAGAPDTTSTTTFTLSDQSSAGGAPVVNNTTSVIDSDPAVAPTVTSSILWQNTSGQASIWNMDGNTVVGGGAVSPNPGPSFRAVGTGDFNKDGHSDVLWQNSSTGQASIWEMSGNSLLGGGPVSPNPGLNFDAVGTGDFNGDGFSGILWQNTSTGQASIWEMNGNTLTGGGPVTPNPGPSWKAIGTGDFNKDGDSDILWQNTNTGQVSIWEMHGNTLIGGGPVTPNPGTAWQAIGTGDFNHDGFADILLQNKNTGQVSVWEMNGNNLIGGGQVANPGTSWHAVGTGAGGSDILLQNTSGQATIWDMSGNTITGGGPVSPNPGPSWHTIGLT
jgi:ELWxxDGT repeat protein